MLHHRPRAIHQAPSTNQSPTAHPPSTIYHPPSTHPTHQRHTHSPGEEFTEEVGRGLLPSDGGRDRKEAKRGGGGCSEEEGRGPPHYPTIRHPTTPPPHPTHHPHHPHHPTAQDEASIALAKKNAEDQILNQKDTTLPIVITGPIVGKVTHRSAVILLEVDRRAMVTCTAYDCSSGIRHVIRQWLDAVKPKTFRFDGLDADAPHLIFFTGIQNEDETIHKVRGRVGEGLESILPRLPMSSYDFLLLHIASRCSWCLVLVCGRSKYTPRPKLPSSPAVSCCLPMFYNLV